MSVAAFASVWLIHLLAAMSPGPSFVVSARTAVSEGFSTATALAIGFGLGAALWAATAMAGLALLFETAGWLYHAVRIAGAAYLIFMGLRMIWTARATTVAVARSGQPVGGRAAFRRGLLTDLANPKAAAFFTSLFAVAVPPTAPLWFALAVIAIVVLIAAGWYGLVAWVIAAGPVAAAYQRMRRLIAYVTGTLFVGFGLRLAAER